MAQFKVGDKVKIIGNHNCHEYEIGEEDVIEIINYCGYPNENGCAYKLKGAKDIVRDIDLELVVENDVKYADITVDKCKIRIDKSSLECVPTDDGLGFILADDGPIITEIKKGELDMKNEVLELWYKREKEKIEKEYDEKKKAFLEENDLAKKYRKIVNDFQNALGQLYISDENKEQKAIVECDDENDYKYEINAMLLCNNFDEIYKSAHMEKLAKLTNVYNEVKAMLSLSQDLDYQLDILSKYEIIDKKTRKMVD